VLQEGQDILEENVDKLHVMADALMQYETIDSDQIDDIMEGRTPREPSDWNARQQRLRFGAGDGGDRPDRSGPIGGPAGEQHGGGPHGAAPLLPRRRGERCVHDLLSGPGA
jgi:cell division protease FtsH